MKTRQGFVSNSSSSSFIIGVGKVQDETKLTQWLKTNGVELNYDVSIVSVKDLIEDRVYSVKTYNNQVIVESFQDSVSIPLDTDPNVKYFVVNYCGDEGDYAFDPNDDGDNDYDIVDFDWFPARIQKAIEALGKSDSGIDTISSQSTYGAGRNG